MRFTFIEKLKDISSFISFIYSAISSFNSYYAPYLTILFLALLLFVVIGSAFLLYYFIKMKITEKKLKKFKLEAEEILEEIEINREKIKEE